MSVPCEKLQSGHEMPWVGLGTWMAAPGVVGESVEKALNAGYRHIDCAHAYLNQPEIGAVFGKVFAEGKIARSDVFITSKIWNTFHSYERAKESISTILRELQLDYVDLMLIHWPMGYEEGGEFFPKEGDKMRFSSEDYLGTWKAMEEAVAEGRIRSLGVSNFNHTQMERLMEHATVKLSMVQVELHPYFQQAKLRAWCKEKGVAITAYSSLGNPSMPFRKQGDPNILLDETVIEMGKRLGKTPAQIALRWAVQHGIHVIPKSTNETRIQENLDLFSFSLTDADMVAIDALDKNWRILDLSFRDSHHPHFPYKTAEDWPPVTMAASSSQNALAGANGTMNYGMTDDSSNNVQAAGSTEPTTSYEQLFVDEVFTTISYVKKDYLLFKNYDDMNNHTVNWNGIPFKLRVQRMESVYEKDIFLHIDCNSGVTDPHWSFTTIVSVESSVNDTKNSVEQKVTFAAHKTSADIPLMRFLETLNGEKECSFAIDMKSEKWSGIIPDMRYTFTEKTDLCDAVLMVQGRRLYVCRSVLALQSIFFHRLFFDKRYSDWKKDEYELRIPSLPNLCFEDVQLFLTLVYPNTDAANIKSTQYSVDEVETMLEMARYLECSVVMKKMETHLLRRIEGFSSIRCLLLADRYRLSMPCNALLLRFRDATMHDLFAKTEAYTELSDAMKKALTDQRVEPRPSPPLRRRARVWTPAAEAAAAAPAAPPVAPAAAPYIPSRFTDEERSALRALVYGGLSRPSQPAQPHPAFAADVRYLRGVVSATPHICERAPELLHALTYLCSLSGNGIPPAETTGRFGAIIREVRVLARRWPQHTEETRDAVGSLIDQVNAMRSRAATVGDMSGAPASKRPRES